MQEIFTKEEETKIKELVKEYRKSYADMSQLYLKMEKIKEDLNMLTEKIKDLKEEESKMYVLVTERNGVTVEQVQKEATKLAMETV